MSKTPRNLLFLFSDQHAARVAGCYGDPLAETPALDALAARGVTFDAAICPSPMCVPSRMAMLTARHPHRIGVWGNEDVMHPGLPTMAHALGAAGLQLVNPKVWMMALAVVGVFSGAAADAGRYAIHALLFFLFASSCLAASALLGGGAAQRLDSAAHMRRFNYAMALLLVVSALLSL